MLYDVNDAGMLIGILAGLSLSVIVTALFTLNPLKGKPRPPSHHVGLSLGYLPWVVLGTNALPTSIAPTRMASFVILGLSGVAAVATHVAIYQFRHAQSHAQIIATSSPPTAVTRSTTIPEIALEARVVVHATVSSYREGILEAERAAESYSLIQYRIPPHFLTNDTIRAIAESRYGEGHPDADGYLQGQLERKNNFLARLTKGAPCREVFSRERLLAYVQEGGRSASGTCMSPAEVVDALQNWKHTLLRCNNYHAGISDGRIPLKYHLLGPDVVVFHEPVRRDDHYRVNSLFIYGNSVAGMFAQDFELVWSAIAPEWRSSSSLAEWIDRDLIPLARNGHRK